MRSLSIVFGALVLVATFATAPATAQSSDSGKPILHVSDRYKSCFFDLHPELTQGQFKDFAGEIGSILRFRQIGDPATIGKGRFEIGLQYTNNPVNEAKGAWNNTMSHPAADHYLGSSLGIPRLVARYGVSDRVDLGAYGTINPSSNYGVVGIDSNIALLKQGPRMPVSVSIRPSISALAGPSEVWAANGSIDVSIGRTIGPVSPYVGFVTSGSLALERSSDVDLKPAVAEEALAYVGLSYRVGRLVVSADVEKGRKVSYAFRIGTRF